MRWLRLGVALVVTCLPVSLGAAVEARSVDAALADAVSVEPGGTTVGQPVDGQLLVWQVSGVDSDDPVAATCTVTDDVGGTLSADSELGPVLEVGGEQMRRVERYEVPPWVSSATVDCSPDDADLALTPGTVEPHPAHGVAAPWFAGGAALGALLVGAGLIQRRRDEAEPQTSAGSPRPGVSPSRPDGSVIPPVPGTEHPRVRGITFRPPGDG